MHFSFMVSVHRYTNNRHVKLGLLHCDDLKVACAMALSLSNTELGVDTHVLIRMQVMGQTIDVTPDGFEAASRTWESIFKVVSKELKDY